MPGKQLGKLHELQQAQRQNKGKDQELLGRIAAFAAFVFAPPACFGHLVAMVSALVGLGTNEDEMKSIWA